MSKILALALKSSLEDLETAEVSQIDDVEYTEADLETSREESIQMLSGQDTADRLNDIADKSDAIADAGEATPATAELMGATMESLFENHGVVPTTFSFESHGGSTPADYHRAVASNLRTVAKHIEGESAVSMESFFDHVRYLFSGHQKRFAMAKKLLLDAQHEFAGKKDNLKKLSVPINIDATSLQVFWAEDGVPKDILASLSHGQEISKWFMIDYPGLVKAAADAVTAAVNSSKVDTPEGIAKLTAKLETIKHPLEDAPTSHFQGWPLLFAMGLRRNEAKGSGEGIHTRFALTTTSNKVVIAKRLGAAVVIPIGAAIAAGKEQHIPIEQFEKAVGSIIAFYTLIEKSDGIVQATMKQMDADLKVITERLNRDETAALSKAVTGFFNNMNVTLLRGIGDVRKNASRSGGEVIGVIQKVVKAAK
jgi:hypothetical protein